MIINTIAALLFAYIVGSIPFGLIIVKIATGRDVRSIGSGRTGGTNVMRAAGVVAGAMTAVMDVIKGYSSTWIVGFLVPGEPWVQVMAALAALLGSIHSVFLAGRDDKGRLIFRGGAGGATCLGGAMALWFPSLVIVLPIAALVFIFIGYASVTTISVALASLGIFLVRAISFTGPWEYIGFCLAALGLIVYTLQPNLKRLRNGTERTVGLRAYLQKKKKDQSRNSKLFINLQKTGE